MIAQSATLRLSTKGHDDCVDITARVNDAVRDSRLGEGLATISAIGSTASITTIEFEPGVVDDLRQAVRRLFPENARYAHHETAGDDNGFAHVRASFIGPSITIPVSAGKLQLGTWQQIILLDFDARPRERTVIVQLLGTAEHSSNK